MDESLVIITEEANLKLKLIISNAIVTNEERAVTKAKVISLIDRYKEILKEHEAPNEFINDFELSIKQTFIVYYEMVLKAITKLLNDDSTKELKQALSNIVNDGGGLVVSSEGVGQLDIKNLREYMTTQEIGQASYYQGYTKKINEAIESINDRLAEGKLTLIDASGRVKSVRNMAEITVRHKMQVEDFNKLADKGVKFVVASAHANASERCSYWQSKIFIVDTTITNYIRGEFDKHNPPKPTVKGYIDGKPYYSLNEAIDNGFLGWNCQHRLIEYKKGMHIPTYSAIVVNKQRDIAEKQRYLERKIRVAKERQELSVGTEDRKKYIEESKQLQKKYNEFCKSNNVPIFEWRTRITQAER